MTEDRPRIVIFDIETNGLKNPTSLWCIVCRVYGTKEKIRFTFPVNKEQFLAFASDVDIWVGHNAIEYDCKWLEHLLDVKLFNEDNVRDTLVLSRLLWVGRPGGHSLESWGNRLKFPKGDFTAFDAYSTEMLEYCEQDVDLTYLVYERLVTKLKDEDRWGVPVDVEHRITWLARRMHEHGFTFDIDGANKMLDEVTARTQELYNLMVDEFPPRVVETQLKTKVRVDTIPFNPASPRQVVSRLNEFGWSPVEKTKGHLQAEREKSPRLPHFREYGWKVNENNLATLHDGAPKACELLVEWLLVDARRRTLNEWIGNISWRICLTVETSTDTKDGQHLSTEKNGTIDLRLKNDSKDLVVSITKGTRKPTWNDDSRESMELRSKIVDLWKLPKDVDAKFVEKARSSLLITVMDQEMYVDCSALVAMLSSVGMSYTERPSVCTSLIRGRFNPLGTVTQRWVHSKPNMGNVPAAKTIKYNQPHLRKIAIDYGARMRSFWTTPKDTWLVGVDMESAHLRIFGHLINDKDFIEALVSGDKKLGTDPHSLNKDKLGDLCVDRDRAKTFIFTFLNGGGGSKTAQIFDCTVRQGNEAIKGYVDSYPGLKYLKKKVIPSDASRGYCEGVDGRLIICDSEHHMMGVYLQSAESIIMKYSMLRMKERLDKLGIPYHFVNCVHDEVVIQVDHPDRKVAEMVGKVCAECIKWAGEKFEYNCPLDGESQTGRTWLEVH